MRCRWLLLFSALIACSGAWTGVGALEVIEEFQSDVQVHSDGSMQVIETITVIAEGKRIKRGIYRDFPTVYRDRANHRVQVRFDVLSVRRNGVNEPWFVQASGANQRLYIGNKQRLLEPGRHSYEITYRTNRQLGFFKEHDELYWNVTGNDWAFPVKRAVAYVYLPKSVPASAIALEAYTGTRGAKGKQYDAGIDDDGVAWFKSTGVLRPGAGMTIVVAWPKGHVREPTREEQVRWFLEDNGQILAGILGALALFAYYLIMWLRVGRDPRGGVIVTRYTPPKGCSPAAMRFVQRMGYDAKAFTAALVNLAAKGYVSIKQNDNKFTLLRNDGAGKMAPGERALFKALFGRAGQLVVEQRNHATLSKALDAHKSRLEADYERLHFVKNVGSTVIGVAITVAVLLATLFWPELTGGSGVDEHEAFVSVFMTVWLSGWTFGVIALLTKTAQAWGQVRRGGSVVAAIFLSVFSLPFLGAWVMGAHFLTQSASVGLLALIVFLIGINVGFYQWMKAPTLLGRALLDEIEGFREYLTLAEGDELRARNPDNDTVELFEAFLPYAIALDVEDVWGERFQAVLDAASRERGYRGPAWYSGDGFAHGSVSAMALTNSIGGAMASSISSSSRAPGSSSGGGGGGSSGGGGGGGGGGGW